MTTYYMRLLLRVGWLHVEHARALNRRDTVLHVLLKRYLDNHCANADAEGLSALCECRLCRDTRRTLASS
jgi:hypothetical protein